MDAVQKAQRKYTKEIAVRWIGYIIVMYITARLGNSGVGPVWRIVLAVLPVVPLAFVFQSFVRYFRSADELQRRIQSESCVIAFGSTVFVALVYGVLEHVGLPHINVYWLVVVMISLWSVAEAFLSQRYR